MIKKVLVIGASHFLGYHISRRLVKLGFYVNCLVDKINSTWRLTEILGSAEVLKVDFQSPDKIIKVVNVLQPEHIIFVSNYGAKKNHTDKQEIEYRNLKLLKEILPSISEIPLESFLHFSTYLEHFLPQNNLSCGNFSDESSPFFREIKNMATAFLQKEAQGKKLPIYTIRPGFVYGSYFSEKTPLGNFILDSAFKKDSEIDDLILNKDFIHVRDVIDFAISVLMTKPSDSFVFDCVSGNIVNQDQIINVFKQVDPSISIKVAKSISAAAFPEIKNNIKLHENYFSWTPKISLQEGFKELLKWTELNRIIYKDGLQEKACFKNLQFNPWV